VTPPADDVPHGRIRRTMPLAGFTARAAGGRMVAGLREKAGNAGAVERFHERTAERYADLLGHSKGVLMKAGQIISMLEPGAIGNGELSPYQKALTRLQADAPPMDTELAVAVLEADLGRGVDDLFADFTPTPMAAASIGQVHRATLHDGRDVAVKIQYPGAAQAIRHDLANTELLTTFVRMATTVSGTMLPDPRVVTREIAARISEEIDYRHEAASIAAFSELYRDHPFIRIPKVIEEASGDRVLTMTYLDGMDWGEAQQADQGLKDTWAEVIWRFVAGSYRHGNLFHADPHPGNYRFGADGTVGFLDFGCVKVLPELLRRRVVAMLRAIVEERTSEVRELMVEVGFFDDDSTITTEEAHHWYAEISRELLVAQPVTFEAGSARRAVAAFLDVRDPDHVVRRMSVPEDLVLTTRINLSVNAICAALHATVHLRALVDDMDGVAEPITALGKQHVAWVRQRGLPFGQERHEHT
jgi:predicted unusual protein kinase regulating ubiquinone biosynthesis (AarF/ABC1/UbiB family)